MNQVSTVSATKVPPGVVTRLAARSIAGLPDPLSATSVTTVSPISVPCGSSGTWIFSRCSPCRMFSQSSPDFGSIAQKPGEPSTSAIVGSACNRRSNRNGVSSMSSLSPAPTPSA